MNKKIKNQNGFTILEISLASVVAGLLVAIGILGYQRVSNNASRSTPAVTTADKKAITIAPEEEAKVSTPPPQTEVKPAPAPTKTQAPSPKKAYTYIKLNLGDAVLGEQTVAFSASLPSSYNGKCSLTLRHLTNGSKVYKEAVVNSANCAFQAAKTELSSGQWKYYVNFYSNDGAVKGESDYKTFSL